MSIPVYQQHELVEYIEKSFLHHPAKNEKLTSLIQLAKLETILLGISIFESAKFKIIDNGIIKISDIELDRLSLVHPPSFRFSMKLQITGYFFIKYKSSITNLPSQVDPFIVEYTGVIIQMKNGYEIRNESVELLDKD